MLRASLNRDWTGRSLYWQAMVSIKNKLRESYTVRVASGVRQGDSLSPVFINDLAEEIRSVTAGVNVGGEQIALFMYADDIALIFDRIEGAQKQLDKMTEWCEKWHMHINAKKVKSCTFENPRKGDAIPPSTAVTRH